MKNYDVTIGIPVYRARDFICQTMDSVLEQTYPSIEFLIVDDCGQDGSISIIEEYKNSHPRGKDIRIISQEWNMGVSAARNRIIDEARGGYLYFMDADDTIAPNTILLLWDELHRYQAEIAYGSFEFKDNYSSENNSKVLAYPSMQLLGEDRFATYMFKQYGVFQASACNCLINLAFLRRTGIRFLPVRYWEDMAFTRELSVWVSRAVLLSEITYYYNCHAGSLSNYQKRDVITREEVLQNVQVLQHLKGLCKRVQDKPYLPYLCYEVGMNSFYVVCHILKNKAKITPAISTKEMREYMAFPISGNVLSCFRHKPLSNLMLWIIPRLPIWTFLPVITIMGKVKKVL